MCRRCAGGRKRLRGVGRWIRLVRSSRPDCGHPASTAGFSPAPPAEFRIIELVSPKVGLATVAFDADRVRHRESYLGILRTAARGAPHFGARCCLATPGRQRPVQLASRFDRSTSEGPATFARRPTRSKRRPCWYATRFHTARRQRTRGRAVSSVSDTADDLLPIARLSEHQAIRVQGGKYWRGRLAYGAGGTS